MSWRVIILTTLSPREGLGQPGADSEMIAKLTQWPVDL